jgi:hypothetical protein
MTPGPRLALVLALAPLAAVRGGEPLVSPSHRIAPDDPAWARIASELRARKAVTAEFTENRRFPFKKEPTVLRGEVRVSPLLGLSLHYVEPREQTVIIDDRGLLLRSPSGDSVPPADATASAANAALVRALRLDFAALAADFDLYGELSKDSWTLALVPKEPGLRRTLGRIAVEGAGPDVRRIELRRSPTQRVEILVGAPRVAAGFGADEVRRFFR